MSIFVESQELAFDLNNILVDEKGYYEVNYRSCNRFVKHPHLEMYKSEAVNCFAPELKKKGFETIINKIPYVNHKVLVSITRNGEHVDPLSLLSVFKLFEVIA